MVTVSSVLRAQINHWFLYPSQTVLKFAVFKKIINSSVIILCNYKVLESKNVPFFTSWRGEEEKSLENKYFFFASLWNTDCLITEKAERDLEINERDEFRCEQ